MGGPGAFAAALACSLLAVTSGFTTPMPPSVNSTDGDFPYSNETEEWDKDKRIAHGWYALPGQYPYNAVITINHFGVNCGGSLVQAQWVITASHCVYGQRSVQVGLGVSRTDVVQPQAVWQNVDAVIIHPEYRGESDTIGDISLLHLPKPVAFNRFIFPIRLPNANEVITTRHNGLRGEICGFGVSNQFERGASTHLKGGYMLIRSQCPWGSPPNVFCGAVPGTGDSTCRGDSGGGFVVATAGSLALHGVSSHAWCDGAGDSTFVRITSYLNWINHYIMG